MSRLAVYLLGPPRLERDGESVQVSRRKVMALLAYLAVTGQSHSRETLVTLLSPELDQSRARSEFRRTLSVLSSLLGEGFVAADRESVGLNPDADPPLWLDVDQFQRRLATGDAHAHDHPPDIACPQCLPLLEEAIELYRDDFVAGFNLPDSLQFEEWQFFQAEGLRDQMVGVLERLVRWHAGQKEYERAVAFARRWLELDPTHEPAHRQLMELYAESGRRGAALRQYRTCIRVLEEELGVPPSVETTALYERIRAEREALPAVSAPTLPAPSAIPSFLEQMEEPAEVERPVFVAREGELQRLDGFLQTALAGQGQVAFVTGGPGRGKTALMDAFAQRAMDVHPDLLVATGHCNAYSGVGDPYLPFRKALGMLTGDLEAHWAAGAISRDHARRVWDTLPMTVGALLDHGPLLIDIFLPGSDLLSRAAAAAPESAGWLGRLKTLVEGEKAGPGELAQSQLFEGYAEVLRALASRHPLLLLLDDLQWADSASVDLLFHLGRESGSSRILILGAYRPEEVALGREDARSPERARHPLEKVLAEFKRHFGDVWVDLTETDQAEGRRFVDAFLDGEPNRLGEDFRRALFRHTAGHPLFTVELLRAMQERGDLVRNEQERWVEGPTLDWQTLPPRVEGVIEERVGRLEEELRDILSVASVEGEAFTAQVVAQVGEIGERQILRQLSRELEKRHRLVQEQKGLLVGRQWLSRYRFVHALFQGYLYNDLSRGERVLLHREIADILEELYAGAGRTEEIVVQLAHHYAEAREGEKAVEYSLRAGDQARLAYAHQEAIDHYRRALVFLKQTRQHERAARTLMKLGLTYHSAFDFRRARLAYDEGFAVWQQAAATLPSAPPPPAPHPLRKRFIEPTTLDPNVAWDVWSSDIIDQLFSGLVELTPELDAVPDVAITWEVSQDGSQYVFHLREDARWSDGAPVTAGDFEYAWKRALDPVTEAPYANLLYDIKGARAFHQGELSDPDQIGVRALDDVTLLVELEGATSYFPLVLTNPVTFPLPRHALEAHGEAWTDTKRIVTNGPFRLESWQRGGSMILARNPDYGGRFTGNLQSVELHSEPVTGVDPFDELAQYEADRLDLLNLGMFSPTEIDHIRQRHADEYVSVPTLITLYVGFDASRPPFNDPRVRRAFALATDKEKLADEVKFGNPPAMGGFIPPGMPGHSAEIGLPYDPDQARQLLAAAGYPQGRDFPAVELLAHLPLKYVCAYFQAEWGEILGVRITWKVLEPRLISDRFIKAPPHMYNTPWIADYPDPDNFLRCCPFSRYCRWRNETFDRLVEKARRLTDHGQRLELYQRADRILMEETVVLPYLYGRHSTLVKPWLRRALISPSLRWQWKHVIIESH